MLLRAAAQIEDLVALKERLKVIARFSVSVFPLPGGELPRPIDRAPTVLGTPVPGTHQPGEGPPASPRRPPEDEPAVGTRWNERDVAA